MKVINVFLVLVCFQVMTTPSFAMANDTSKPETGVKYSWKLNDADKTRLFEGIKLIRYGDSVSEVKTRLGRPIKEYDAYGKQYDKFLDHELIYAVQRVEREGGNVCDQEITLNFDKQGKLFQIDYNAMLPIAGQIISSGMESQSGTKYFFTKPPAREN